MAFIEISNLDAAGSELFAGADSFLNELETTETTQIVGGWRGGGGWNRNWRGRGENGGRGRKRSRNNSHGGGGHNGGGHHGGGHHGGGHHGGHWWC